MVLTNRKPWKKNFFSRYKESLNETNTNAFLCIQMLISFSIFGLLNMKVFENKFIKAILGNESWAFYLPLFFYIWGML